MTGRQKELKMAKVRTTQKAIKEVYQNVIAVGYCNLQSLLDFFYDKERYYTVRREGWGSDVYDFGLTAISTGYAPFGNIRPSYDLVEKYEHEAQKLRSISLLKITYPEKRKKAEKLMNDFIKEALAEK